MFAYDFVQAMANTRANARREVGWTMMDPMDIVVPRINKSFPENVVLILLHIRMRGCLILVPKGRAMSIQVLLSLGVVRDTRVGVWPVEMVVMGVVRVDTRGRIALRQRLM